ncbi:MAG: TetR/AcrR family transcriptional regulator [Pseudomonadota bacterium]|uniref:TetR/AcrR family transcriptional regulator n=1 Tax=Thalassospira TaxID=168934 RepID=UPI000DEE17BA|nr:TetR/AcrR family transcriptional regulator [Thalassospira sp.]MBO6770742.1 TetR/AcrR family transcriptional regulator [Thalassospira sp.]MEE3045184.1 TetR/AcrR family transcriptional regulator [Pseudomonadota bacterium]RCK28434.1 transcriptional regulator [Thalassospira profundimaris]
MSTRDRIIETADRLFYQQGFEATSFADIASAVGISRGNFYHHFKTKDDILDAVINQRLANTEQMLDHWEVTGNDPAERIRSFIHILIVNGEKIRKFGCPVGTLSSELAKLNHSAQSDAAGLFTLFRTWLGRQFSALGFGAKSDGLAMHILGRSQGVATLANAFDDNGFLQSEVTLMCDWLDGQIADLNRSAQS